MKYSDKGRRDLEGRVLQVREKDGGKRGQETGHVKGATRRARMEKKGTNGNQNGG